MGLCFNSKRASSEICGVQLSWPSRGARGTNSVRVIVVTAGPSGWIAQDQLGAFGICPAQCMTSLVNVHVEVKLTPFNGEVLGESELAVTCSGLTWRPRLAPSCAARRLQRRKRQLKCSSRDSIVHVHVTLRKVAWYFKNRTLLFDHL